MRTGEATWDEGLLLFLERSGYPEETYHTFSYSPLPDDDGAIGGMLCVVTEDTERVIGERRLATLRELAVVLAAVRTEPEVLRGDRTWPCGQSARPAVRRRLAVRARKAAGAAGLCHRDRARASACRAGDRSCRCARGSSGRADPCRRSRTCWSTTSTLCGPLPTGAWDRPPRSGTGGADCQQGQTRPAGMLLGGLNPFRPFPKAIAASSIWWHRRSPLVLPVRAPMRRSGNVPRRWPRSIAPRPHSSPMSATSSARR